MLRYLRELAARATADITLRLWRFRLELALGLALRRDPLLRTLELKVLPAGAAQTITEVSGVTAFWVSLGAHIDRSAPTERTWKLPNDYIGVAITERTAALDADTRQKITDLAITRFTDALTSRVIGVLQQAVPTAAKRPRRPRRELRAAAARGCLFVGSSIELERVPDWAPKVVAEDLDDLFIVPSGLIQLQASGFPLVRFDSTLWYTDVSILVAATTALSSKKGVERWKGTR